MTVDRRPVDSWG